MTPSPRELSSLIASTNRRAVPMLVAVGAGCAYLLWQINWQWVVQSPWPPVIVIGAIAAERIASLVMLLGRKKKRIEDLREDTVLGGYDKHMLVDLVSQVKQSLGVPQHRYPTFITRGKDANAHALDIGGTTLFQSSNGVYIERQTLHQLKPPELAFVIGHELGHCFRYPLMWQRFFFLHLLMACSLGVFVLQAAAPFGWLAVLGGSVLGAGYANASQRVSVGRIQAIEHLCDCTGAEAAGAASGVNALLKISAFSETSLRAQAMCLELALRDGSVNLPQLLEMYQENLPFGPVDKAVADEALSRSLGDMKQKQGEVSAAGLFQHVFGDDDIDEEAVEEFLAAYKKVSNTPVLDWAAPLREAQQRGEPLRGLTDAEIDQLVQTLKSSPDAVLFRLPHEVDASDSSHPSTRDRVVYLWENRQAIAAGEAYANGVGVG